MSSGYRIRRLDPQTKSELDAAVTCGTLAFHEDSFCLTLTGRKPSLIKDLNRAIITAGLIAGEVFVAESTEDDGPEMLGIAVWFPPGRKFLDSDDQICLSLEPLLSTFPPQLRRWWERNFLSHYKSFTDVVLGPGTLTSSYHLQWLGTVPSARRCGIASSLISVIRKRAIDECVDMCLEVTNPSNLSYYRKQGFRIRGKTHFKNGNLGEFGMWSMVSQPSL